MLGFCFVFCCCCCFVYIQARSICGILSSSCHSWFCWFLVIQRTGLWTNPDIPGFIWYTHVIGFSFLIDLWVTTCKIKKLMNMILCARSTSRRYEQSTKRRSRNENMGKVCLFYSKIIKHGRHIEKFTRCAKVCGLFFLDCAFLMLICWVNKLRAHGHLLLNQFVLSFIIFWSAFCDNVSLESLYHQLLSKFRDLQTFLCVAAPFGTPVDMNPVTVHALINGKDINVPVKGKVSYLCVVMLLNLQK